MRPVSHLSRRAAAALLSLLLMASEAGAEICIDVHLKFAGRERMLASVQSMQNEASAIWKPYGVRIQWLPARDVSLCPRVHTSVDVLIEDQPSADVTASAMVLGSTRVGPARLERVPIYMDYDETALLLESLQESQLFTLLGRPEIGPADLGRALGRVLAHEIGHVVLGAPGHQGRGLMRKWFTAPDLVAPRRWPYTLSREEIKRLRQHESHVTVSPGTAG